MKFFAASNNESDTTPTFEISDPDSDHDVELMNAISDDSFSSDSNTNEVPPVSENETEDDVYDETFGKYLLEQ